MTVPFHPVGLGILLVSACAALAEVPSALTVGDRAPAFRVSRWVKGRFPKALPKGEPCVVEFWATWCGPCRQTIPHLAEIARVYRGRVHVVGVDVWEKAAEGQSQAVLEAQVDDFVRRMGAAMDYPVARDTADGHMANAWLKAAGQGSIPTAFVVDRRGRIAWIGHPAAGLDKVLDQILEGRYDLAAARAEHEKAVAERKAQEAAFVAQRRAMAEVRPAIEEARKAGRPAEVITLVAKAVEKYPDLGPVLGPTRFVALVAAEEAEARRLWEAERPERRMGMVQALVAQDGLPRAWYDRAVDELAPIVADPKSHPSYQLMHAKALYRAGRLAEAVTWQERLIAYAREQKAPEPYLHGLEADLELYRQGR